MQYSRLRLETISAIICLASTFSIAVEGAPAKNLETRQMFELRVIFGFPWKERVEIKTNIRPNVPFSGGATDKEGHRYKIGGMLLPHKKGKYRVVITMLRWDELGGETFGTLVPDVDLNKTDTVCSSDGIIHGCVATTLSAISGVRAKAD